MIFLCILLLKNPILASYTKTETDQLSHHLETELAANMPSSSLQMVMMYFCVFDGKWVSLYLFENVQNVITLSVERPELLLVEGFAGPQQVPEVLHPGLGLGLGVARKHQALAVAVYREGEWVGPEKQNRAFICRCFP